MLNEIFITLLLLSMLGLVVGLIKPSWVRMKSRKMAAISFGASFIIFFIATGVTAPPTPPSQAPVPPATKLSGGSTSNNQQSIQPAAQASATPQSGGQAQGPQFGSQSSGNSQAASQSSSASQCTQATVTAFSDVLSLFSTVYQSGKNAVGTTQYADANAGLEAFSVPGSPANMLRAWHIEFNDKIMNANPDVIMSAYDTASNCYSDVNATEPDALGNWSYDMMYLQSDISTWGNDASDWQVSNLSTVKLQQDEAKVEKDFSTAQGDINALK